MLITVCLFLRGCVPEGINTTKNFKWHCKSAELNVALFAETNNGVVYQDNESTIVSDTSHPELLFFAHTANAQLECFFYLQKD